MGQELVSIKLDAKEILEHVDDMLAWEAIASVGVQDSGFVQRDFFRAEPFVRIDRNTWGVLTPASLEAYEPDDMSAEERQDENARMFTYFNETFLPSYLEDKACPVVRYCKLVEHAPDDEIDRAYTHTGDSVDDMLTGDGAGWRSVRYHLESVGELDNTARRAWISQMRLPQVARLFRNQHVVAFTDGRSTYDQNVFAYWNRRFFDIEKRPLALKMSDGKMFHPSQKRLGEAAAAVLNRSHHWEVELALSRDRTGIALQTDAPGALALANMLRGSDTASGRRKTLVHWVDEHMRRRRKTDADATVRVRAHFRGANRIDAGRYHLRVWPAADQLTKASNGARYGMEPAS